MKWKYNYKLWDEFLKEKHDWSNQGFCYSVYKKIFTCEQKLLY